jgi:hypothetical protein
MNRPAEATTLGAAAGKLSTGKRQVGYKNRINFMFAFVALERNAQKRRNDAKTSFSHRSGVPAHSYLTTH